MANVTWADLDTTLRNLLRQPSTSGRFSDQTLLENTNLALQQVMLDVEWPEVTFFFISDGINSGIYLPEMESLLRVYVAGQACSPTSRPIMEGMYMGGPINYGTLKTPAWTQAPFTGFPAAANVSIPNTAGSLPWFQGQAPSYFPLQGGAAVGIIPPPTAGWIVAIDAYPVPPQMSLALGEEQSLQTFFPQMFREAIAMRSLMYAFFSLGGAGAAQLEAAAAGYKEQIVKLQEWKKKFFRSLPQPTLMPTPHRTYFRGPYRGPTGRGSRQGS